jgi:hypothetical protein
LGLSDVNVAAPREEIQLHEVAQHFPEGAEAQRAEPAAAPSDCRRGGGHSLAATGQTKGASNSGLLPSSSLIKKYFGWFFQFTTPVVMFHIFAFDPTCICCTMLEQAFAQDFVALIYSE